MKKPRKRRALSKLQARIVNQPEEKYQLVIEKFEELRFKYEQKNIHPRSMLVE